MCYAFPFLATLVVFASLLTLGSTTCADDVVLTLVDDASQFSTKWNPFAKDYKEWWFFTVSDPVADVAFCMGYAYYQPNAPEFANMSVIGGMYWPTFQQSSSVIYILDNFTTSDGSKQNATMNAGPNDRIHVVDETTYIIEGITSDGTLQWNLTYTQLIPGMREVMTIGYVELDWISYMPLASVEGEIVYEGKKIPINSFGYHDHNWGVWPSSIFNWVWAQYGDASQKFAIVMGAYNIADSGEYVGYVFLRVNGIKTKIGSLCGDKYTLVPLQFEEWNGHKYSVQNQVEVKGKEWWLQVNYSTITNGINPGGKGLNLLVFEQVSQYNVSLWQTNGKGGWDAVVASSGHGFNEWSDVIHL